MNYYNDNDPFAAEWLRNLIDAGLIPRGEVNERSIQEPPWGAAYRATQAHFFAGVGGWPLALRLAGWPDDEPIWTASLPCQPWSAAGQGLGEEDHRHLWPDFRKLVARGRPPVIAGEQVASAAGRAWLAGVRDDLEALGYRFGAADLCSACVGSPNIRQRLFWVADLPGDRLQGRRSSAQEGWLEQPHDGPARRRLAQDAPGLGRRGRRDGDTARHEGQVQAPGLRPHRGLADVHGDGRDEGIQEGTAAAEPRGARRSGARLADSDRQGQRQRGEQERSGEQGTQGHEPDRRRAHERLADDLGAGRQGERAGRERRLGARGEPEPARGRRTAGEGLGEREGLGRRPPRLHEPRAKGKGQEARQPLPAVEARLRLADAHGGPPEGREHRQQPGDRRPGRRLADAQHHAGRADLEGRQAEGREADGWAGPWSDCVLIPCTDGTARRIGRGVFPLAHGLPRNLGRSGTRARVMARLAGLDSASLATAKGNRIGRLKGYGNAINPWVAAEWIMAYREARGW